MQCRIRRAFTLFTAMSVWVSVSPAYAQRLSAIPSDTHMRLVTCTGATIAGKFAGLRGDSVEVAMDSVVASTVTFPPQRVTVTRAVAADSVRV